MLSIEYNIVVFTSVFYQKKKFFVNLAFHFFLKKSPVWSGGWDLMLFFRRCKRCPFGIYEFYRLHLTSGGQLHTPGKRDLEKEKKTAELLSYFRDTNCICIKSV